MLELIAGDIYYLMLSPISVAAIRGFYFTKKK